MNKVFGKYDKHILGLCDYLPALRCCHFGKSISHESNFQTLLTFS